MYPPIRWKQLNSLASIDMFTCPGDPQVTHQSAVREVPSSLTSYDKNFLFFFDYCCGVYTLLSKHIFVITFSHSFIKC